MTSLTHSQIWQSIDKLAELSGLSASGLARRSGLAPTSFNKSKRFTSSGRERWPSTESVAKILRCTGMDVQEFMELLLHPDSARQDYQKNIAQQPQAKRIPVIGFAQAGTGGYFDDGGFPVGEGWDQIVPPGDTTDHSYALKVSGDSMMPLYREGDILIVDPESNFHKGDRVILKTQDGQVLAKTLKTRTSKKVELKSINPSHPDLTFTVEEIDWIARIVWASQ
jgi:phage repressor protein C with HTH and peptisase S24 domain